MGQPISQPSPISTLLRSDWEEIQRETGVPREIRGTLVGEADHRATQPLHIGIQSTTHLKQGHVAWIHQQFWAQQPTGVRHERLPHYHSLGGNRDTRVRTGPHIGWEDRKGVDQRLFHRGKSEDPWEGPMYARPSPSGRKRKKNSKRHCPVLACGTRTKPRWKWSRLGYNWTPLLTLKKWSPWWGCNRLAASYGHSSSTTIYAP